MTTTFNLALSKKGHFRSAIMETAVDESRPRLIQKKVIDYLELNKGPLPRKLFYFTHRRAEQRMIVFFVNLVLPLPPGLKLDAE